MNQVQNQIPDFKVNQKRYPNNRKISNLTRLSDHQRQSIALPNSENTTNRYQQQVEPIIIPWFPVNKQDLSAVGTDVNDILTQSETNLLQLLDPLYIKRKNEICSISRTHIFGEEIPRIAYSELEHQTWVAAYKGLNTIHPQICPEVYLKNKKDLEKTLAVDKRIPSLQDLDSYISEKTGFKIKTAQGWLTKREYLNALAHRVFPCTQYIRPHSTPEYTAEPDMIHDIIGHLPYLADPTIADICQNIGLLSIGASDSDIEKLGTIFLQTIEFGVFLENGKYKAYGAGIAGSSSECLIECDKPFTRLTKIN